TTPRRHDATVSVVGRALVGFEWPGVLRLPMLLLYAHHLGGRDMGHEYSGEQRRLQEQFDTTRLADRLSGIVHDTLSESDQAFIEARDMFFLATVDAEGHANCSYKGGDPGFVRVVD